jgi:trimeric autotransporter adhesin
MKLSICWLLLALLLSPFTSFAQTPSGQLGVPSASTDVPKLVRFSGKAMDDDGKPLSGAVGVIFSLYKDQQGGSPLWVETQNVQADATGHYTALLGSASVEGVPLSLFSSGEAQWLGVQVQGQPAQPRVLLVSVPYALKAHEAETLSGKSISDFVLLNKSEAAPTTAGNAPAISNGASGSKLPSAANGPTSFVGSNTTQIVTVTQKGTGAGLSATASTLAAVAGTITGKSNTAVYGLASNTTKGSNAAGVTGVTNTQTGPGVQGVTTSAAGFGVQGVVNSSKGGTAVQGLNNATSGISAGVSGQSASTGKGSAGVAGNESATTGQVYGVLGSTSSTTTNAMGVSGYEGAAKGQVYGVNGYIVSNTTNAAGVNGNAAASSGQVYGVNGYTTSTGPYAAAVNGYEGATSGQVYGVSGGTSSTTNGATGVSGNESATTGVVYGVSGSTNSTGIQAAGVFGFEGAATGLVSGVMGSTNSSSAGASGVNGYNGSATGPTAGVVGSALSTSGDGVYGNAEATTGTAIGVYGQTSSTGGDGVAGIAMATTGGNNGVYGQDSSPSGDGGFFANNSSTGGTGVIGVAYATSGEANGVFGQTSSPGGVGGVFTNLGGGNSLVIVGNGASFAQVFTVDASGNVNMKGKLTKGGGSFKIDHPLDPTNKYLSHSFVESPDMMNVYNGNIMTDKHGLATIVLPDYFEALNRDFRYQLTVIGQFAQAIVKREITNNRFTIKTSKPSVKVSWQVTGIRHDAYADAYRIPTEEEKPPQEQGHYLHPELFGASEQQAIGAGPRTPSTASNSPTRASLVGPLSQAGQPVK